MKSIKNKALKKTIVAVDTIKEYNDKIEKLNKLKSEIYINKGLGLINLLEKQVNKDIKKCTSDRYKLILLIIKQKISLIKFDSRLYSAHDPDTCQFRKLIESLIRDFNDVTKVSTDFMTEHKEIHTIYTCMVNLELEFRKLQ